ncbi:MAG: hypothetical protein CMC05_13200 [Flavobacteriaceae bacterium]|nr:hypothetical protein [Flavobacteriaceae bacterium]MBD09325.1 hypothetical protein [Flavobacteriaceae bacterium]|tara:strand:+ start:334 stop:534 length:201 start_codon:yes stop_codon:yes gene_type:complete
MIRQKVITVNIYTGNATENADKAQEVELKEINKYLDQGYTVIDRFTSPTNSAYNINITFVLQKETE